MMKKSKAHQLADRQPYLLMSGDSQQLLFHVAPAAGPCCLTPSPVPARLCEYQWESWVSLAG
jgi:hypothetical protein